MNLLSSLSRTAHLNQNSISPCCLFRGALDRSAVDVVDDVVRGTAIDGASNAVGSSEHFLARSGQLAGHRARSHHPSDANHFVEGDVAVVLDVLDLLAVPRRFLQGFHDERSGRRHNRDRGLSVLDGQAHGNLQTLPVSGGLGNVVTDLLRGLK